MFNRARQFMVLTVVFVVLTFMSVPATIIHVPANYDTIQLAINASNHGDTVLVAEGHYYERINFYGKSILLTSEFMLDGDTLHIQNTIIDADTLVVGVADTGSVVCFVGGEDSISVIQGFTIQNGIGTRNFDDARRGGGIYCYQSSPTICNNTISGNSTCGFGHGGGIYCAYSNATIINNTIKGNSAYNIGGGITCFSFSSTISNNTIIDNDAYVGGGISGSNFSSTIINNTISRNHALRDGGGIYCSHSAFEISNTIFWANSAGEAGNEIYIDSLSSLLITYSDIQDGWEGDGNIDIDPLFRDPDNGDFHLMATYCGDEFDSPCIDAGHPDSLDAYLDCEWGLGEPRSDMGAYGGNAEPQTDIKEQEIIIPNHFILMQNYPNPFNATTTIKYELPTSSRLTIDIYDLLGRKIKTLIGENQQAGSHQVTWNAENLTSGMYFYKLQAGDHIETKKMLLLK